MPTLYMDMVNGNDSNDGTTFALRFKTFTNGATAARIAPGDVIRIMKSPDPTLVGDATWTDNSATVTLATAVNADVWDADSGYTAAANGASITTDTSQRRQGTASSKVTLPASPAINTKYAYRTITSVDLSAYQQISFWIRASAVQATGRLRVCLCSDTLGNTIVDSFPLEQIYAANAWHPMTVDKGAALGSAIQSVAIYSDGTAPSGSLQLWIDNVIACKAASSADSLSLKSLIGKVYNMPWEASTSYAQYATRRPTQANRNGYIYRKVNLGADTSGITEPVWPTEIGTTVADGAVLWECFDVEDTWYPIKHIIGATITLDRHLQTTGSLTYQGPFATASPETIATYKREPIMPYGASAIPNTVQDNGNQGAEYIEFAGGYDTTDMSTLEGETWVDMIYGSLQGLALNSKWGIKVRRFNCVRTGYAVDWSFASAVPDLNRLEHCAFPGSSFGFNLNQASHPILRNVAFDQMIASASANGGKFRCLRSVGASGTGTCMQVPANTLELRDLRLNGCTTCIEINGDSRVYGLETRNGGINRCWLNKGNLRVKAWKAPPPNENSGFSVTGADQTAFIEDYDLVAGDHRIFMDHGSIVADAVTRHTASGLAWRFAPSNAAATVLHPLVIPLAQIALAADTTYTLGAWFRRDGAGKNGVLRVRGGQIAGVPEDVTTSEITGTDAWEQKTLQITPTAAGVIEVLAEAYYVSATGANVWVDDLSIA